MDILSDVNLVGNLNVSNNLSVSNNINGGKLSITHNGKTSCICGENFCVGNVCANTIRTNAFYTSAVKMEYGRIPTYHGNIFIDSSSDTYAYGIPMFPKTWKIHVPANCTVFVLGRHRIGFVESKINTDPTNLDNYLIYPIVTAYFDKKKIEMDIELKSCYYEGTTEINTIVLGSVIGCSSERIMRVSMMTSLISAYFGG